MGFRIFPELRKVLGCHMPNFRSLGQSLHIDNFCKIDRGGGGGPLLSFCSTKPKPLDHDTHWFPLLVVVIVLGEVKQSARGHARHPLDFGQHSQVEGQVTHVVQVGFAGSTHDVPDLGPALVLIVLWCKLDCINSN